MNEKLKAARLKKLWTVKDACRACRVGEKSYQRWEAGEVQPNLSSLKQLVQGFGLTPEELGYEYLTEISAGSKNWQAQPPERISRAEQPQKESQADSLMPNIVTSPSIIVTEQS